MRGHSDPAPALLLGLGAGVWLFFKGFRVMREYKVLEDTPRIPIRSVPMGFVHIRGQAQSAQLIPSPVSQTPCCFYKVDIDEWKSEGRSRTWVRCSTDFNGYQFHLADDTGKILIDAHAAEYDLPLTATRVVDSNGSASNDAHLLQYVQFARTHSFTDRMAQAVDKRFTKAGASDNPQLQAKREALRDVFAGISSATQGGKPPIEALQRLFNATGPLADPVKEQKRQMLLQNLQLAGAASQSGLLDHLMPEMGPASGRFRLREYVVTPGQEYLISGTCMENCDSAAEQDRSMIAKGPHEPTFVISTKSDVQIHHALEKRALLMIFGGAAAALLCTVGLLVHFGLF
jgi:hypothetical protein